MTILIVDDSRAIRALLTAMLHKAGHRSILNAESAVRAFTLLGLDDGRGANDEVDLILMDLTMPEVDGIAALRRIHAEPGLHDVPVIVVTGSDDESDLKVAFDAGAFDYIIKPVSQIELLARVSSALKLKGEMDQRKAREVDLVKVMAQLAAANQQLQHLSLTDSLTDVANRRHFDQMLAMEWAHARRCGSLLGLLLVDIDYFKRYNDRYGHQAGDVCLQRVAGAFGGSLKRMGDLVARYGGEEFGIILPQVGVEGGAFVAERLRTVVAALAIPHADSPVGDTVTVTIGVATVIPGRDDGPEQLIALADQALYRGKREGRNCTMTMDSMLVVPA